MQNNSAKIKVYCFSSFILSLILAALFTAGYLLCFDNEIGYFNSSFIIPYLARAATIISLVWILTAFIIIPKNTIQATAITHSQPSKISAVACAIAMIFFGIYRFISLGSTRIIFLPLTLACIASAILSSVYFFLIALAPSVKKSTLVLCGFLPILWAALSITEAYVNRYVTMNNPMKNSLILSMMSVMLFMLYELRFYVNRGFPRLFLVCSLIGVLMPSMFSLPFLITFFCGGYTVTEFIPAAVVVLFFLIYIVTRLFDFISVISSNN